MKTKLAFGKGDLEITLPDHIPIDVIEPKYVPGLKDQEQGILDALSNPVGAPPLADLVSEGTTVGIIFSDISRATPYHVILPPLLEILEQKKSKVTFFNATGTHRVNTREELISILGENIVDSYPIVQNDCTDSATHTFIGKTSRGNDVSILTSFLECDIKVLTGFIEPHFFAGFSGGAKAVMPGLALLSTIQHNHGARNIDDGESRWGITEGNPIWEDIHEAVDKVENTYLLNVAMNSDKQITKVFAGNLRKAHAEGIAYVREHAMARVPRLYDLVITSNSGYPLDLNLYQAVKGMSAAAEIVKDKGAILVAAECWDGIPSHGSYGQLLAGASSPEELLRSIRHADEPVQDMWQAQIHARICQKADVHFYTKNLTKQELTDAFLYPVETIEETVGHILGQYSGKKEKFSICVLPQGPLTIPYFEEQ